MRLDIVETMEITLNIPKGFLPEEAMRELSREALRREVPLAQVVREALLAKAAAITGAAEVAAPVREEVAA